MDGRPRKRRGVVVDGVGDVLNNISAAHVTRMGNMEIRAVVTMRTMCNSIAEGKSKLPTDGDVSRALKNGIKKGVQGCKSVGDQLSTVGFEGFNDQETQTLERILKTARVIVELGGSRHRAMLEAHAKEENMEGEANQIGNEIQDSELDFSSFMEVEVFLDSGHVPEPISWPVNGRITLDWILCLMKTFKLLSLTKFSAEFSAIVPFSVVDEVIERASLILQNEPNCVEIHCDMDAQVVVVGNLHGQYLDFLQILESAGLPSTKRLIVFNGGYINKGMWSFELLLVLLAWKVFLPENVFLLRGNDESKGVSRVNGFSEELKRKFPDSGPIIYRKFLGVFSKLPLASVIGDSVYTTYGGLFRSDGIDTVEDGKQKLRGKKPKKLKVEKEVQTTLSLGSLEDLARVNRFLQDPAPKDAVLRDVLWSNPTPKLGFMENDKHDAGVLWGPDCTETFLRKNNLKLIIRSHKGPDARAEREGFSDLCNGYSMDHEVESGKLYTIYSAPDYSQCHRTKGYTNRGAYAILKSTDFASPEFITFEAAERPKVEVDEEEYGKDLGDESAAKQMGLDTKESARDIWEESSVKVAGRNQCFVGEKIQWFLKPLEESAISYYVCRWRWLQIKNANDSTLKLWTD